MSNLIKPNKMKRSISLFVIFNLFCAVAALANRYLTQSDGSIIYSDDDNTHLIYRLYPDIKQAMLGDGTSGEHNALAYPPMGDSWWTEGQPNLWSDVTVPSTVVFQGDTYTVTSIGSSAFYQATGVKRITLPETVTEIKDAAFSCCINLEEINIPEGVPYIGRSTFYLCRNLKSIKLPSTIGSIGAMAFINCTSLTSINIPGKCESIGDDAFSWCLKIAEIVFEDGNKPLQLGYAYEFGPDWQSGNPPYYSATRFWRGLFSDCKLHNVYIGRDILIPEIPGYGKVTPFESCVFKGYDDLGKQVVLHDGQSIALSFGDNVTKIPDHMFDNVWISSKLKLPKNISEIGDYAFDHVSLGSSVVFPETFKYFGDYAFNGQSFDVIEFKCSTPPEVGKTPFNGKNTVLVIPEGSRSAYQSHNFWKDFKMVDPADAVTTVEVKFEGQLYGKLNFMDINSSEVSRLKIVGKIGNQDWETINTMNQLYDLDLSEANVDDLSKLSPELSKKLFAIQLPKNIQTVEEGQFKGGNLRCDLVIPESCSTIGASAFSSTSIESVTILSPSLSIMENAFSRNTNLTELTTVDDNEIVYGKGCFAGTSIHSITIGAGSVVQESAFANLDKANELIIDGLVEQIDGGAFYDSRFSRIEINGGVKNMGDGAFGNCYSDNLYINDISAWFSMRFTSTTDNLVGLADHTFVNDAELVAISVPENVSNISDYFFANCKSLKSVAMPNAVTSIGSYAFAGCEELESVDMSQNINSIGDYAFADCTGLQSVSLSNTIRAIGSHAFQSCKSLNEVSLPSFLKSIPDGCFSDCSSLSKIIIPSGTQRIGSSAFKNCEQLNNLLLPSSLRSIGEYAFYGCMSITSLELPYALSEIGQYAFASCQNLRELNAKWITPLDVNTNVYQDTYKKCIMWVPANTAAEYYKTGWYQMPLIDEGFYSLVVNNTYGGIVSYGTQSLESGTDAFIIDPDVNTVELSINPSKNYYVSKVSLGENDITSQVTGNKLVLTEINDNLNLKVEYKSYLPGDVNADDYIDVVDIAEIVNYIQEQPSESFVFVAADVNEDKSVDVGDISGTVNLIFDAANYSPQKRLQMQDNDLGTPNLYVDEVSYGEHGEYAVPISLNNDATISGIQFEVKLQPGYYLPLNENGEYVAEFNEARTSNLNIKEVTLLSNGNYQVLCASTSNSQIQGDKGSLLILRVYNDQIDNCSNFELEIDNIRISDANAFVTHLDPISYCLKKNDISGISSNTIPSECISKRLIDGRIVIEHNNSTYDAWGLKTGM